jgi:cholesterol transport system auxiliary component
MLRHRAVILWSGMTTVCLLLADCSLLAPHKTKAEEALLDQLPSDLPHRDCNSDTLLVFPPQTAPVYDTMQMAYRTQPHQVAYFTEREWGETPAQMLYPLVVKTLENTHSFRAVLVPPYTGRYTSAVRTEILEMLQDFTAEPATLVLTLRIRLTDYETRQLSATKEVAVRQPMQQRTSQAGVIAANEATADALRQMASFVLEEAASSSACHP